MGDFQLFGSFVSFITLFLTEKLVKNESGILVLVGHQVGAITSKKILAG